MLDNGREQLQPVLRKVFGLPLAAFVGAGEKGEALQHGRQGFFHCWRGRVGKAFGLPRQLVQKPKLRVFA